MNKNPNSGHRKRLRNKFISNGIETFEKHEVLELLLFYAIPRRDTNKIAHRLIDAFGSIDKIFDAPKEDLIKSGISVKTSEFLKSFSQILKAYYNDRYVNEDKYIIYENLSNSFIQKFSTSDANNFIMLLNSRHKCMFFCDINSPLDMETLVSKVISLALRYTSPYVVVGRNHFDSSPIPNEVDLELASRLKSSLGLLNMRLLDYVTVGNGESFSMCFGSQNS